MEEEEEIEPALEDSESADLFETLDLTMSHISSLVVPTTTTTTTSTTTNSHHCMQQTFRWKKSNGHEESFPVSNCSEMLELWADSSWSLHKTSIVTYCENLYCNLFSRLGVLVYHMQDEVLRKLVARFCVAHAQQHSSSLNRIATTLDSVQNVVSVANISLRGEVDPEVLDQAACVQYGKLTAWSSDDGNIREEEDDDPAVEQLNEAPVVLDTWEYYWGNIFFAWWRQNKEHSSVSKYISALKIHYVMTVLLDKLIENVMKTTTKLRSNLISLCNTKRKESIEALIWKGDPKGANFQYTMWHWGIGQLQRLNEYWDLVLSSMNTLNDVKVQIAQLISKCSLKLLYKDEKLQIRALLKTSVLHDIGEIVLEFEEWFRTNREATGITIRTQNRFEQRDNTPLVTTTTTTTARGLDRGYTNDNNPLLERYCSKLNSSYRWFCDRELKANYDKIMCWVLEDYGSSGGGDDNDLK